MHEVLRNLPPGSRVLDLGCAGGSFESADSLFTVFRIDLERGGRQLDNFAQADAARLPFPDESFEAVISNHSLEHFENLEQCLGEIGRVVKPHGALYIAVPDSTTISDRLYQWLARGGGHVNPFSSDRELAQTVERATGLHHVATRTLSASLSCLHRCNRAARAPRRLWLLGGGTPASLLFLSYVFRLADRFLHTRLSVYGWALYFGNVKTRVDCRTWSNVCIRCGSGHASDWLRQQKVVRRRFVFESYRCPACGAANLFTDDKYYGRRD